MNHNDKKRNEVAKKYGYKTYQEAVAKLAVNHTAQSICLVFGICHKSFLKIIDATKEGRKAINVVSKRQKKALDGDIFEPDAAGLESLWYQVKMEVNFLRKSEATRRNVRKIFEEYNFDRWGIYQGKVRKVFNQLLEVA